MTVKNATLKMET